MTDLSSDEPVINPSFAGNLLWLYKVWKIRQTRWTQTPFWDTKRCYAAAAAMSKWHEFCRNQLYMNETLGSPRLVEDSRNGQAGFRLRQHDERDLNAEEEEESLSASWYFS